MKKQLDKLILLMGGRPLDNADWETYQGAEEEEDGSARIAEIDLPKWGEVTMLMDDWTLQVHHQDEYYTFWAFDGEREARPAIFLALLVSSKEERMNILDHLFTKTLECAEADKG